MDDSLSWLIVLLILIYAIGMGVGVNLKKWYGWVQIFFGSVLGFFVGFGQGIIESLLTAALFAVLLFLLGPIMWKRRHF